MVRTYVRKTNQGSWSQDSINEAVKKVKSREMTLRRAADCYDIPYTTLRRRITAADGHVRKPGAKTVMDKVTEQQFAERLIHLAKQGFDITPKNVRKYAYNFIIRRNLPNKFNKDIQMAGEDWFRRFMKRNINIAITKPKGLSMVRIDGMQVDKVNEFYNVLEEVIKKIDVQGKPECIYNQDATSMASIERGQNVTVIGCMNAAGSFIPPLVIFKGVRKRDDFMVGMPSGTEIFMSEKGWVTEKAFKAWLCHFNRHRTPGKVILILNGHPSHTNLAMMDLCEDSDIELILIPPHLSRALQPLDVSFFKPLKTYYDQQATSWQHNHPGKRITKVVFSGLLKHAWNLSASVSIATKGFEATGIYPFNPSAIPLHKYVCTLGSEVDKKNSDIVQLFSNASATNYANSVTEKASTSSNKTTHTLKAILSTPEKQPLTKRVEKSTRNPILYLTSPENTSQGMFKPKTKATTLFKKRETALGNKGNKKKGRATHGLKIKRNFFSREWCCIYCNKTFINPPVEDWTQCQKCKEWCHKNCGVTNKNKQLDICKTCV